MKSLMITAAVVVTACLVGFTMPRSASAVLDATIDNPGFNKVMPVADVEKGEYQQQVSKRLEHLVRLLLTRDVSTWPAELQAERMKNIQRLHDYRLQGKFPTNYDHPQQLPCFYDRDGNLCAVANLVAQSAGIEMVRQINNRYQYATVSEMEMPELDRWIAQSGLTRAEIITIQEPGFSGTSDPFMNVDISASEVASLVYGVEKNVALSDIEDNPTDAEIAEPETAEERVEELEPQVR